MNADEVSRLAAMTNQLRPDWPWRSLKTFIETELYQRAYRDCAVALAIVATDPATRTPRRVLEAGPWWHLAPTGGAPHRPLPREEWCDHCGKERALCQRIAKSPTGDGHDFDPGLPEADPETGELVERPDTTEARARARAANRQETPA